MVKVFCDICGNPATIGLDSSRYSVFVTTESLHMYKHHICPCCAEKIGIMDHIKAGQAESEALKRDGFNPCEIVEDNKDEQAK